MNFTLRDYQQDIYNQIPYQLKGNSNGVLVQSPARSGKSKIIAATSFRIQQANKIPIVLTHRDKIHKQLIEHCNAVAIDAKSDKSLCIELGKCYVAMQQTIINRPLILNQIEQHKDKTFFITDEAHRGDFNKIFDLFSNIKRIGFTATPAYKWAKHLPKYYNNFIHGQQISELVKSGNITPIQYFEMRNDLSTLKKRNDGEFTEESQRLTFDKPGLYDGLFTELKKFTFKKAIVFCNSKKSADLLNEQFLLHNYKSVVYYSGHKSGAQNIKQFEILNTANVLISVAALSEGYDNPEIDMNILYCAIGSLPKFIQAGSRNMTPHQNKPIATTLDFGGNNSRFGGSANLCSLTMDRDWSAMWQAPPIVRLADGVVNIKYCPRCEYLLKAMEKSCCNCGYIYPASELLLKEGELIKISNENATLTGRRVSTLSPEELAMYAIRANKKTFCMRVAKSKSLTDSNFAVAYGKAMDYSNSWADRILKNNAEILSYQPDYKIDFNDLVVKI